VKKTKKSKYARKVTRRRRIANKAGLPDMPWPILRIHLGATPLRQRSYQVGLHGEDNISDRR